ncbi:MAG: hypothetical protein Q9159_003188 [Coniocarpon cinnabarinum]
MGSLHMALSWRVVTSWPNAAQNPGWPRVSAWEKGGVGNKWASGLVDVKLGGIGPDTYVARGSRDRDRGERCWVVDIAEPRRRPDSSPIAFSSSSSSSSSVSPLPSAAPAAAPLEFKATSTTAPNSLSSHWGSSSLHARLSELPATYTPLQPSSPAFRSPVISGLGLVTARIFLAPFPKRACIIVTLPAPNTTYHHTHAHKAAPPTLPVLHDHQNVCSIPGLPIGSIVLPPFPRDTRPYSICRLSMATQGRPGGAFGTLRMGGELHALVPRADDVADLHAEVIREKVQDGATGETREMQYTQCKIVGNGSFGVVFQTKLSPSGEDAAIKRVLQDKRFKNRELQIMRIVRHPNIVELKAFYYSNGDRKDEVYLNLVLEYVPETVYRASRYFNKMKTTMPILEVKLYIYQLFRSLAYIHSQGICHRDIKPQNLLLDPVSGILKLCDFGSAKILVEHEPNVSYICSRYYRAPELIFGATNYTTKIDVWSTGCVMAELMLGQPLFPGESGIDQLVEIIKVLGTPTRDQIRTMNPNYMEHKFPQIKPHPFNKVFKRADNNAIDLISKLLEYTPTQRLSAIEAMVQPFFDELRDPNTRLQDARHANGSAKELPNLFDFSHHELSIAPHLNQKLVPQHVRKTLADQGLDVDSPQFRPLSKEEMMARLD